VTRGHNGVVAVPRTSKNPVLDRDAYRGQLTAARDDLTLIRDTRCPFCLGENATGRWRHDRACLLAPATPQLPAWATLSQD
jgi:hypothetical protein